MHWAFSASGLSRRHKNFLIDSLKFWLSRNYFWYGKQFFLQTRGVAMGAQFAPSVANLFMAHWEEKALFKNRVNLLPEIYRWPHHGVGRDKSGLDIFMQRLNANNKNITLTCNVDTEQTCFPSIWIYPKRGTQIRMANHFKLTDGNAFISVESYHYSKWLCNNQRGQFIRLRLNCSYEGDFVSQSQVLASRFLQKGVR